MDNGGPSRKILFVGAPRRPDFVLRPDRGDLPIWGFRICKGWGGKRALRRSFPPPSPLPPPHCLSMVYISIMYARQLMILASKRLRFVDDRLPPNLLGNVADQEVAQIAADELNAPQSNFSESSSEIRDEILIENRGRNFDGTNRSGAQIGFRAQIGAEAQTSAGTPIGAGAPIGARAQTGLGESSSSSSSESDESRSKTLIRSTILTRHSTVRAVDSDQNVTVDLKRTERRRRIEFYAENEENLLASKKKFAKTQGPEPELSSDGESTDMEDFGEIEERTVAAAVAVEFYRGDLNEFAGSTAAENLPSSSSSSSKQIGIGSPSQAGLRMEPMRVPEKPSPVQEENAPSAAERSTESNVQADIHVKAAESKAKEPEVKKPKAKESEATEPKTRELRSKEPKAKEPEAKEPKKRELRSRESKAKGPEAKEPEAKHPESSKKVTGKKDSVDDSMPVARRTRSGTPVSARLRNNSKNSTVSSEANESPKEKRSRQRSPALTRLKTPTLLNVSDEGRHYGNY